MAQKNIFQRFGPALILALSEKCRSEINELRTAAGKAVIDKPTWNKSVRSKWDNITEDEFTNDTAD